MGSSVYIEVLTSPNCVHSPRAVSVAKRVVLKSREPVIMREVSIASREGAEKARMFKLDATPAIVINGLLAYVGVPELKAMRKMVRETREKEEERSSYFF